LDFFKYAQGGPGKRKADTTGRGGEPEGKKRRLKEEGEENDEGGEDEDDSNGPEVETPAAPKHRVTAKGSNVPDHVETFMELKGRYQIPSHILSNLAHNGYTQPTGIQSHGIPILLEVRHLKFIAPAGN
jgi:ATP-dependent RNA helicase DDX52/ROK1